MKYKCLLSVFMGWLSLITATGVTATTADKPSFTFEQGTFAGLTLPYRKTVTGSGNHGGALVIYLHGGSHKGNDNISQMNEPAVDSIAQYLTTRNINATFVVPQCPADKSWSGTMMGALKQLVEHCQTVYRTDPESIYLLGGSMGGTGTWNFLSQYPGTVRTAMARGRQSGGM